jgi:hypothetical protein
MKQKGWKKLSSLYIADEEQTLSMTQLERQEHALGRGIYLTERVASMTPGDRRNALNLLRRRQAEFRKKHGEAVERARRERGAELAAMLEAGRSARRTTCVALQSPPDFSRMRASATHR